LSIVRYTFVVAVEGALLAETLENPLAAAYFLED
jgi:hypothetical protein